MKTSNDVLKLTLTHTSLFDVAYDVMSSVKDGVVLKGTRPQFCSHAVWYSTTDLADLIFYRNKSITSK